MTLSPTEAAKQASSKYQDEIERIENLIDGELAEDYVRGSNFSVEIGPEFDNSTIRTEIIHRYEKEGWKVMVDNTSGRWKIILRSFGSELV